LSLVDDGWLGIPKNLGDSNLSLAFRLFVLPV
jgi:hypothetical protein